VRWVEHVGRMAEMKNKCKCRDCSGKYVDRQKVAGYVLFFWTLGRKLVKKYECNTASAETEQSVVLCGLVVSVLTTGPKFRGIFKGDKNP
jgi:hypothetical protein